MLSRESQVPELGLAVQVVTKGDQVHVPSETLLEFNAGSASETAGRAGAH
jgi:hypothetical protein